MSRFDFEMNDAQLTGEPSALAVAGLLIASYLAMVYGISRVDTGMIVMGVLGVCGTASWLLYTLLRAPIYYGHP